MPTSNRPTTKSNDPRWFIWTIVFLLVSGVSLVSYIMITSGSEADESILNFPIHRPKK